MMRYLCSLLALCILAASLPNEASAQFYKEPEEVRKLKSINPLTRAKAIESIGEQGEKANPQAVSLLGKILLDKYEDRANRLAALESIKKVGTTRAEVLATDLRNMVRMRDRELSAAAKATLEELGIPLVPTVVAAEPTNQTNQAQGEPTPAQIAMRNDKVRDALNLTPSQQQQQAKQAAPPVTTKQPAQTAAAPVAKTPQELSVEEAARLVATSDKVTPEMVLAMFAGEGKPDPRYTSGSGVRLLVPKKRRENLERQQQLNQRR